MKVFDSSPDLPLKPPRRRLKVAVISGVVVLLLAGSGVLFYLYQQRGEELSRSQRDLSAAREQIASLQLRVGETGAALDAARTNADSCSSKLTVVGSKITAFAKQAASCERLRSALNMKG